MILFQSAIEMKTCPIIYYNYNYAFFLISVYSARFTGMWVAESTWQEVKGEAMGIQRYHNTHRHTRYADYSGE